MPQEADGESLDNPSNALMVIIQWGTCEEEIGHIGGYATIKGEQSIIMTASCGSHGFWRR